MLPPALLAIGARLHAQDNRCTASPLFIVQQQRSYRCEPDEADHIVWFDEDWNEADDETAAGLTALREEWLFSSAIKPEALREYQRAGIKFYWEFCMAAFTEAGCQQYLELNGHNLKNPRIYAESFNRCPEMLAIRDFLMTNTPAPGSNEMLPSA